MSTNTVQRDTMPNSWQHNKSWVSGKHHHLGQNLSIFTSETPIFMISATEILSMDDFPIYAEYIIIGARTAQRHPIPTLWQHNRSWGGWKHRRIGSYRATTQIHFIYNRIWWLSIAKWDNSQSLDLRHSNDQEWSGIHLNTSERV